MRNHSFEPGTPEAEFAIDVVETSCSLARRIQDELATEAIEKDDRSPVTVADFAIQALIGRRLGQTFPGEILVGEESADLLRKPGHDQLIERITNFVEALEPEADADVVLRWIDRGQGKLAQRFWVVDPIDGTKGFLRGAQYAVALACVEDGQVKLGVLGCPRLELSLRRGDFRTLPAERGCLVVAVQDRGAWVRPLGEDQFERLTVSTIATTAQAVLVRSVESGHTNVDRLERLLGYLRSRQDPVLMDSQAKYGLLAAGQVDLLLRLLSPTRPDYREKIWDQAAGSLVVEEAGGTITDLDGKALDFSAGRKLMHNRGVLASNGRVHETVLAALRQVERDD